MLGVVPATHLLGCQIFVHQQIEGDFSFLFSHLLSGLFDSPSTTIAGSRFADQLERLEVDWFQLRRRYSSAIVFVSRGCGKVSRSMGVVCSFVRFYFNKLFAQGYSSGGG